MGNAVRADPGATVLSAGNAAGRPAGLTSGVVSAIAAGLGETVSEVEDGTMTNWSFLDCREPCICSYCSKSRLYWISWWL